MGNLVLHSRVAVALLLISALAAPSRTTAASPAKSTYESVRIEGIPHVRQRPDFCGEACAEMVLKKLGKKQTQDDVFGAAGLDPLLGRGCYTAELAAALRLIGFNIGPVWFTLSGEDIESPWRELHADLVKRVPSIVCMHSHDGEGATEHFRLIVGYDAAKDEVIYHEPAENDGAYRRMKRAAFLKLWPLSGTATNAPGRKTIRFRMEPRQIREPAQPTGHSAADYAQHVRELREKVPSGFTLLIEKPFVVVGDGSPAQVKAAAMQTIRWAVQKLKQDYFAKDPDEILDVWLFKDAESYEKHNKSIFKAKPTTPFGYYSAAEEALIMNIATGGGTLVHEIVHPFVAANFPHCPAWFNEGLGSLYEQSAEKNGHIVGLTNWRLAGLQAAIKDGEVSSFETLTGTSDGEFYGEDRGTNYAQARYLCYYLQERGLLTKFYKDFVANRETDTTGYKTLKKTLGEEDMDAFKKKWEAFVMKLKFP